jgi:hypothetical protein
MAFPTQTTLNNTEAHMVRFQHFMQAASDAADPYGSADPGWFTNLDGSERQVLAKVIEVAVEAGASVYAPIAVETAAELPTGKAQYVRAEVYNDSTEANNGIYSSDGDDTWTQISTETTIGLAEQVAAAQAQADTLTGYVNDGFPDPVKFLGGVSGTMKAGFVEVDSSLEDPLDLVPYPFALMDKSDDDWPVYIYLNDSGNLIIPSISEAFKAEMNSGTPDFPDGLTTESINGYDLKDYGTDPLDQPEYESGVIDENDKQGIARNGADLVARAYRFIDKGEPLDLKPYTFAHEANERVGFGVLMEKIDGSPADRFIDEFRATEEQVAENLSDRSILSARRQGRVVIGQKQDFDGFISQFRKYIHRTHISAIPNTDEPILSNFDTGQSNIEGGGTDSAVILENPFPMHSFCFGSVTSSSGDNLRTESEFYGLQPRPPVNYSTGSITFHRATTMKAYAQEYFFRNRIGGRTGPGIFDFSASWGGNPISNIMPGSNTFETLDAAMNAWARMLGEFERTTFIPYFDIRIGESESAGYGEDLLELAEALVSHAQAAFGSLLVNTPKILAIQPNQRTDEIEYDDIAEEIQQTALANPSVIEVMPIYDAPIIGPDKELQSGASAGDTDLIHDKVEGRMLHGAHAALRHVRAYLGDEFDTLKPSTVTLGSDGTGSYIDAYYETVPDEAHDVEFDSDWLPATTNEGFTIQDDTGSPPGITGVTLQNARTIRVRLDAAPTDPVANNLELVAGLSPQASQEDYFTSCRCTAYNRDRMRNPYHEWGFTVPMEVRHRHEKGKYSVSV